jgi:flagellar motor protein MotB
MKKSVWERKIINLMEEQFLALWARNEAQGETHALAAIAAYKTVYIKEGK